MANPRFYVSDSDTESEINDIYFLNRLISNWQSMDRNFSVNPRYEQYLSQEEANR
jgi:hypothetical protein